MKADSRMRSGNSGSFRRSFRNASTNSPSRPYELRSSYKYGDSESWDEATITPTLILNRLLILPVFIAIVMTVIAFLGISWLIRAPLLWLPKR